MKMSVAAPIALFLLLLLSCTNVKEKTGHQQPAQRQLGQLAPDQQLIENIHFGMTSAAFFDYCRAMNARQLFTNSNGNQWVQFRSDTAFPAPVRWNFYPEFCEDRICKLNVLLSYEAYAPWNHRLVADSLLKDIIPVFNRWYGSGRYRSIRAHGIFKLIKIDGNRQINFWKLNEKDIQVVYTDLSVASNQ